VKQPSLFGAVLVGGHGMRFGGPKADTRVAGTPMVERVAVAVQAVASRTYLVGRAPSTDLGLPTLPDRTPDAGPLGGLEAALVEAEAQGLDAVLLVACDLPMLEPGPLARLAEELGDAPAVAPAREDGFDTACAIYSVETLDAVRAALASEDRSLHGLFRAVGGRAVDPTELGFEPGRQLLNVNLPGDVDRAEHLLGGA
jgi:molybdopterin-guanine dinucleotide biosynthesis protein A